MSIAASTAPIWLLIGGAGLLGVFLCHFTEWLIPRVLPRLGPPLGPVTRMTTAALTGIVCSALALRVGADWALPAFLLLGVLSVQLARIDLAHHLLPNPLVMALLGIGMALLAANSAISADWAPLIRAVLGAVTLFTLYLVLAFVSPGGIGMGDVKLAAPLGAYLGYLGWSQLFYGGALAFVLGGLVTVAMVATKRVASSAEVAFGPSMLGAALGAILLIN